METEVVLITGGTSGIGLAVAKRFLKSGCHVAIVGRNDVRGQSVVQILEEEQYPGKIIYIQGDVSKPDDCQRVAEFVENWAGRISILVNSAGIYFEKAIEDMTEDDFDRLMNINVKGTYFMTKFVVEKMKQAQSGCIINVSSDAGLQGNILCSAYCASKGAVNLFTKALALELAAWNIRVNGVCPGDVMTPLTEKQLMQYPDREAALKEMSAVYPGGRIAEADEVAAVIEFLASKEAGFVNGALCSVDGGITA